MDRVLHLKYVQGGCAVNAFGQHFKFRHTDSTILKLFSSDLARKYESRFYLIPLTAVSKCMVRFARSETPSLFPAFSVFVDNAISKTQRKMKHDFLITSC